MTLLRAIIAVGLTLFLMHYARTNSEGRSEFVTHAENGYTFAMNTYPKTAERELARLELTITGPFEPGVGGVFRSSKFGDDGTTLLRKYASTPMQVADSAAGQYYTELTAGNRGDHILFYFEVRDNTGGLRATFLQPDGTPFKMKFIGDVPVIVSAIHIVGLLLGAFFVIFGTLWAIDLLRGKPVLRQFAVSFALAAAGTLLGGIIFGVPMNYYAFGSSWEGVPFGTDATDNKTQVLMLYLLFLCLASLGTLTRGKTGRDIFPPKGLAWSGIGGLAVMLAIYLIPHSIQYSPASTRLVCWSWITALVVTYGLGWFAGRRKQERPAPPPPSKRRRKHR